MDAIFIFIFFLLVSTSLMKMYEVPSKIPLISYKQPPSKEKPLALTVSISKKNIKIYTSVPSRLRATIAHDVDGKIDYIALHEKMIQIKKKNLKEKTVVVEPHDGMSYEQIVKVMDNVKILWPTDPEIFAKDKDGLDIRVKELFSNIIFGNIQE